MKTILILALLCVACGHHHPPPFIVDSVTQINGDKKYRVEYNTWCYFYTDTLYTVGDTIK